MKKILRSNAVILLLTMVFFLTACGSQQITDNTGTQTTTAGTTAAATEPTDAAAEDLSKLPDIEFTYFVPDSNSKIAPENAPILQQVYEATKVRLKKITPPAEARERLNIMLATDDLPDMISFWDVNLQNQFIQAGKILRLNELMEQFAPNTLNINWKNFRNRIADKEGNLYYIPGGYST